MNPFDPQAAMEDLRAGDADGKSVAQGLLRERASLLAQEAAPDRAEGLLELTVFTLAREIYGIESRFVGGVFGFSDLTLVPGAPSFVAGIMNFRGTILTLLDLKKFFDLPESGISDLHQVITVRNGGMQLGLLADVLVGMELVPSADVQKSLPTLTGIRADYLKGVTREGLVILDLEKLLADERLIVNQTATGVEPKTINL